jgi:hypothetical protein
MLLKFYLKKKHFFQIGSSAPRYTFGVKLEKKNNDPKDMVLPGPGYYETTINKTVTKDGKKFRYACIIICFMEKKL